MRACHIAIPGSLRSQAETGRFAPQIPTNRGSHGEAVDKTRLTQVGRALDGLGIEHIAVYSPEARGRSERMFGTLQDRLAKELELTGITDMQAANGFIREVYLPAHNERFARPPQIAESAFVVADRSATRIARRRGIASLGTFRRASRHT